MPTQKKLRRINHSNLINQKHFSESLSRSSEVSTIMISIYNKFLLQKNIKFWYGDISYEVLSFQEYESIFRNIATITIVSSMWAVLKKFRTGDMLETYFVLWLSHKKSLQHVVLIHTSVNIFPYNLLRLFIQFPLKNEPRFSRV